MALTLAVNGFAIILLLGAAPPGPIDFDTEVLPVLAKVGCNAGACHGAAAGRGGFKLSLFGGDPAADHRAIVRELEGRRVNLAQPGRSLLLLKPTWQLDHEGGQRFEEGSQPAQLLTDWIAAGAVRQPTRQLVNLVVEPANPTVETLPGNFSLQVTARFDDGTTRRVEDLALYSPADPGATQVDERGAIEVVRPGRHAIVVRFLTHVQAIQVTAAHPAKPLKASSLPRNNWIDDEVNATLAALHLPPADRADDAALLRRITLDLTGRLPAPDHIREFLADKNLNKLTAEIDRLIASNEFIDHWTYKFSGWLRLDSRPDEPVGNQVYYQWLRQQVENRRPLHELVADLITASGDSHAEGPPNFHRAAADARGEAEHVAETLLAIRLRCANCHNHPLDRWTQDDYHGLAAIFAKLDRGRLVSLRAMGEVIHPATGEAALPRIPGEQFLDPQIDGREALAHWLTDKSNRHFARAWVNRFWQSLFGRGLVEPVDDLRDTNPATHPALLDRLTDDFVQHDFDLRHTLRLISLSAAYQRSGDAPPASRHDERFLSHARSRPTPMPILLKLVCQATGVEAGRVAGPEVILRSQTLGMIKAPGIRTFDPLDIAGCTGQARGVEDRPLPESFDELTAQLQWLNGPLLNQKLADPASEFARLAASKASTRRIVEEFYLRTLSRFPNEAEARFWYEQIAGTARGKKCEDLAWSLLSCPEFVTNH